MSKPIPAPSIGRIVWYQRHGSPNGQHKSEPSPAIVTAVNDAEKGDVSICVFNPSGQYFQASTQFDDEGSPGTWRYPPRVNA